MSAQGTGPAGTQTMRCPGSSSTTSPPERSALSSRNAARRAAWPLGHVPAQDVRRMTTTKSACRAGHRRGLLRGARPHALYQDAPAGRAPFGLPWDDGMAERAGTVAGGHVSAGAVRPLLILLSLHMRWTVIHDDLLSWQTVYSGRAGHEGGPTSLPARGLEAMRCLFSWCYVSDVAYLNQYQYWTFQLL